MIRAFIAQSTEASDKGAINAGNAIPMRDNIFILGFLIQRQTN